MNDIETIISRLKENEEIAKKFHRVESKILSILNFKDLFEVLLTEIRDNFKVPYVWISMVQNSEISSLIESLGSSELLKEHLNIIEKSSFLHLINCSMEPVLVNDNLKPFFKLFPQNRKFFIKSLAVAPISLDGDIIGSLNQADASHNRYQPGIDTSLLEQLALKVSLCLSNVTAHEKLKFLAYHDPLTGLLNRRVMEKILARECDRCARYQKPLSVAFLDLDYFKHINDTYGHKRGDDLLVYLAQTLKKMTRQSDVVARFAGDEFVIILPETEPESAANLMERIQAFLNEQPANIHETEIRIALSYGISATTGQTVADPSVLLKSADEKLYENKKKRQSSPTSHIQTKAHHKIISLPNAIAGKDNEN